jgi:hypothetical protein
MLKIVIAVMLLGHGIGHSMGLTQILKVATINPDWKGDSWLLTGFAGAAVVQAVGVVVWTAALLGFVAVAAVVVGWLPAAWWQPLAIAASLASILGLVLFPNAFPLFSSIGAFAVNAIVLAAVIWYHWVPGDLAS